MFVQLCFPYDIDYFYVHLPLSFCPVHRCSYSPHGAYAQSKLALVLFTYRLQHLLTANGSHVTANVVDPGVVNTELYKHVFWVVKVAKWMTAWLFFKVCRFLNNFVVVPLHCESCSKHGAEGVSEFIIIYGIYCISLC